MKELIEALTIILKYKNLQWPTHCEHDVLYVVEVTEDEVSEEDKKRLNELGFHYSNDSECGPSWLSFRYGSA